MHGYPGLHLPLLPVLGLAPLCTVTLGSGARGLAAAAHGSTAVRGMGRRPRLHKEPDQEPQWHPKEPTLGRKPASRTDADSAQVDLSVEEKAWKPACSLPGLGDVRLQQGLGTAHTEAGWRSEEEPLCSPGGAVTEHG